MFYPGGAFALQSAMTWAKTSHERKDLPNWPSVDELTSAAKGFPVSQADTRAAGRNIGFFDDWVTHDKADSYWEKIDGIDRAAQIDAPVFSMAGWYDPFLPSQLADWNCIQSSANLDVINKSRLIIGPWRHGGEAEFPDKSIKEPFRLNTFEFSLDFFDSIRKSETDTKYSANAAAKSPVRIFVMGKNKWRNEQEWPLQRAVYTPFYLSIDNDSHQSGHLQKVPPTKSDSSSYTYDPNKPVPTAGGAMIGLGSGVFSQNTIESRSDVLSYTTEKLAADTEVTGPVKTTLYLSTSAPCTDFTAKLVDVHPDGTAYNVCDGIVRSHFSDNSPSKVEINLWPTSMVFLKAHCIRLEVSSSNFPRFDANPNTGRAISTETNPVSALQHIYYGPQFPSSITLPLIQSEK